MPRTVQPLTPELERHLRAVTAADLFWRDAKQNAHARARIAADNEIANARAKRDQLVRQAVNAGVPLIEFRRKGQGLHTTNQGAVLTAIARSHDLELAA